MKSNHIKWPSNWDWGQEKFHWSSYIPASTCQVASGPMCNVFPHSWPSVVTRELAVHLGSFHHMGPGALQETTLLGLWQGE